MFLDRNPRPLMVGITALALAGTAQAETVLTFNWWVPPTHLTRTEIMNPWAQAVSDATDGEVRIEFTATSLAPPPRQQELIDDGVVDLVMGVHGYTPDRFVNAGVMELPFMTTTGEQASIAYWRPRVAASFGGADSPRFAMLKRFGLRHNPNDSLLTEWSASVDQCLSKIDE